MGKEEHALQLVETAHDGFVLLEGTGELLYANPAAEEAFSLGHREEILGSIRDLVAEYAAAREGRGVRGIWANFPPQTFLVDIFPTPAPPSQFVVVLRDVTRFRAREEQMQKEEALVMLARVASEILHEMKGPLTGIKGAAQLLKEGFDRELLGILEKETRRLEDMLLEMVEFSRPAALSMRETNIHEVLDDTLNLFRETVRQKGVRVVRVFDPSLPLIPADGEKLKRALSNIVKNALEAVDDGGRVSLLTGVALNSIYSPARNMISVRIEDSGPGLPRGFENWLFSPTRSNKEKGLGLGLALAYRIIKEHRGVLAYHPPSTFEILLPHRTV
ncbi:MAG: PAS domain-containing protein [Nitrospirae bacterium]|nr:PAS domain-containing protein [Nitrospirota bacterium]